MTSSRSIGCSIARAGRESYLGRIVPDSNSGNSEADKSRACGVGCPIYRCVPVTGAGYSAATNTVTLFLDGDLQTGDSVIASWTDLRDTAGGSVTGRSPVLAAR